jgi:predicted outer membrane repeat protein
VIRTILMAVSLIAATSSFAIEITGPDISGTWTSIDNPYVIAEPCTVRVGQSLAIQPGVHVFFADTASMVVEGVLHVNGVEGDSVIITGIESGRWGGILISGRDSCSISHAVITNAGTGDSPGEPLERPARTASKDQKISMRLARTATETPVSGAVTLDTLGILGIHHSRFSGNTGEDGGAVSTYPHAWLTVSHSVFTGNYASAYGGAISGDKTTITIMDGLFQGNESYRSGGAVAVWDTCRLVAVDSRFIENYSDEYGGAIESWGGNNLHFLRCSFERNEALDDSGALDIYSGTIALIEDCRIVGNRGSDGGAGWIGTGSYTFRNTLIADNVCTTDYDHFDDGGGAFYVTNGPAVFINCTISGNTTEPSDGGGELLAKQAQVELAPGGAFYLDYVDSLPTLTLNSCIVWNNEPDGIYSDLTSEPEAKITYSDVQDSVWTGVGNLSVDPLFEDAVGGFYALLPASPCVDTGDPALPVDVDGSRADMGAGAALIGRLVAGDASGDGTVTAYDATLVLRHRVGKAAVASVVAADVTGNGDISSLDAAYILLRTLDPLGTIFPIEGGEFTTRLAAGTTELTWEPVENGWVLIARNAPALLGGTLLMRTTDDGMKVTSSEQIVASRKDGITTVAFARTGDDVALLTITGEIPELISATLNEGRVRALLPKPLRADLLGNVPNPFNPTTTLIFTLPTRRDVRLDIYNTAGQRIRTLVNGAFDAGLHRVSWDGRNAQGAAAASGVYFARMVTTGDVSIHRMVLVK